MRLQSILNIVMLSAPMCDSTRRSEAPPSGSYDRSRYPRLHTRTTIGACFLLLACRLEGGPPFPTESREHQDDKIVGESVRLQSILNIVMLSAPMCTLLRSSELRRAQIARGAAKHPLRVRTIEAGTHDFTRAPRSGPCGSTTGVPT